MCISLPTYCTKRRRFDSITINTGQSSSVSPSSSIHYWLKRFTKCINVRRGLKNVCFTGRRIYRNDEILMQFKSYFLQTM